MADNSNTDEVPRIGAKKFAVPTGIKISLAEERGPLTSGKPMPKLRLGAAAPVAAAVPAAPALNVGLGGRLRTARAAATTKPTAPVAPVKKAKEAAAVATDALAAVAEEAAPLAPEALAAVAEEAAPLAPEALAAVAEEAAPLAPEALAGAAEEAAVAEFKRRAAGRARAPAPAIEIPADAPQMTLATFAKSAEIQGIKAALGAAVDAEKKPAEDIYRPITSGEFQNFIYQTYASYSLYAQQAMKLGKAPIREEQVIDQDACKKRDPNKVEFFYYQKFVRDYLSRGTPYRGMLVYHGLGSGKTCTSIAAAEALYWGGRKTIWVLTPATLSNNYRKDIAKCGYFPLRTNNYWQFLKRRPDGVQKDPATGAETIVEQPETRWMMLVMGLPKDIIDKQGGAWIPDPTRPSNWKTLSPEVQGLIRDQMSAHMNHRFKFIHYNGVVPGVLSTLAYDQMQKGRGLFDDAVVIIDEVHNLVRTINGTRIGSKTVPQFVRDVEPTEYNWSMQRSRDLPPELAGKFKYPRGYTLYRLLQNAVNTKIVALSATPMINYAQEFAILMNIIGGEQRTVEISLKDIDRSPATVRKIEDWARRHPQIDFYSVEEALQEKKVILTLTPVPHGFKKVVDEGKSYALRGFVRLIEEMGRPSTTSRERNMEEWASLLVGELEGIGVFKAGASAIPDRFRTPAYQLIMDDDREFVSQFVNRATLAIMKQDLLKARATGLISYYRGGSEELMPRSTTEVVRVPMSDFMFAEYSRARQIELDMEAPKKEEEKRAVGGKGMTAAERDLYAQATKSVQTGFLALSRAACNWVFPTDVPRPTVDIKKQEQLLGAGQSKVIAADMAEDFEPDLEPVKPVRIPRMGGAAAAGGGGGQEEEVGEAAEAAAGAVLADEAPAAAAPAVDASIQAIIGTLMSGLEAKAAEYLRDGLEAYSPKYAEILTRIRASAGPALVYSQFKTLEGLGIFAAVLRAAPEQFLPLDIQKNAATGEWEIPAALMDPARPRYILYTGDQDLDKRRMLLQLYNADVENLPATLAEQCKTLLAGAPDNRDGRIAKVFMITQSGAEGISLFNTRQVHIMEPYWNNVRLEQVIGRAIRLCSHMNLPWDDRIVNVYTYLSVFSEKQRAPQGATGIMSGVVRADMGKTTDEQIFELAMAKQKLADGLFGIAQAAAADCQLHSYEHADKGAVQCYQFAEGSRPNFLYHPDIRRDLLIADMRVRQGPAAAGGGK